MMYRVLFLKHFTGTLTCKRPSEIEGSTSIGFNLIISGITENIRFKHHCVIGYD